MFIEIHWSQRIRERKSLFKVHYSKFQSIKRASVKQLFTNHLGLRIISFTNLEIWKKWREKEMSVVQTFKKVQTIQKVNFVRKNNDNKNFT